MEHFSKLDMFSLDSLGTDHFYLIFQNFSLCIFVHFVYYENKQKQTIKILLKWSIFYQPKTTKIIKIKKKIYAHVTKILFINCVSIFAWRKYYSISICLRSSCTFS